MQAARRFLARRSPLFARRAMQAGCRAYKSGNYAEAAKQFSALAENGEADAQYCLGCMYHEGHGFAQDDGEALRWFRKAAESGNADAQFNLGAMYDDGTGPQANKQEAVSWLRLAAYQGVHEAQFRLGLAYRDGDGLTQDSGEAARWFRFAADQGNIGAQFLLGMTHIRAAIESYERDGSPDPSRLEELKSLRITASYVWLSLAEEGGDEAAAKALDGLRQQMTPEAVQEAERARSGWKPRSRPESTIDVYRSEVEYFFDNIKIMGPEVSTSTALELFQRLGDLEEIGIGLGETARDILKPLRAMKAEMECQFEEAVPTFRDYQRRVDALKAAHRALGGVKRPNYPPRV